jgi:hypothetical protein
LKSISCPNQGDDMLFVFGRVLKLAIRSQTKKVAHRKRNPTEIKLFEFNFVGFQFSGRKLQTAKFLQVFK